MKGQIKRRRRFRGHRLPRFYTTSQEIFTTFIYYTTIERQNNHYLTGGC